MYLVKVNNINEPQTTIWDARVSDNLLLTGNLDFELESVDQFNFSLIDCDIKLKTFLSFVEVFNLKTDETVFRGRTLEPSFSMDEDGSFYTSYSAEGSMAYLDDNNPTYNVFTDMHPHDRFRKIIELHNAACESYKRINIGNITVTPKVIESETPEYNDTVYFVTDPEKTFLAHLREMIVGVYGGEMVIRYESDGDYIDWVDKIGYKKSTEIRIGKNIKSFTRTIDPTEVVTRLIPLGSSEPTAWEGSKRLEIVEDSRSGGKNYIDIPELQALYGIQTGTVIFDDEYTPDTLYDRALKKVDEIKKKYAKVTTELNLLDLSLIDVDPDEFVRGNIHPLIVEPENINEETRIIGTNIDITMPQNKGIRIGDKELSIIDVAEKSTVNIINNTVPAIIETQVPGMIDDKIYTFETETLPQTMEKTIDDNKIEIKDSVVNGINSSTDVIKSQAIVVDYGMIDKLMTNDLLTNRLVANDAYVKNFMALKAVIDTIQSTKILVNQLDIVAISNEQGTIPGAITIRRKDNGKPTVLNGETQFGLNIWRYYPQFTGSMINIEGNFFTTINTDYSVMDALSFKHDSRYLNIKLNGKVSSASDGVVSIEGFSTQYSIDRIGNQWQYVRSLDDASYNFRIDLGIPTGEMIYFYIKITNLNGKKTYMREILMYQEG